ncbi:conserved membrane hypothetical protein [uncultured delta proteobacterium]|uniref:Bile acid:sodium symporter n=1 Tax=uncultured delta proteobacterium TaxID=34034 RepID=A0A212KFF3_9DELT|nr:conserved membrane hypothetical protein [uncultured delta proteobacterium]
MNIISSFSECMQKYFPLLCIVFLIIGLLIGEMAAGLAYAIPWLMALLMFSSGLGLRVEDLQSLRERPWLLPVILALLHVVIPLLAMGITYPLGFPLDAVMGFVILAVIPISATSVVWVGIYRGNVTLGMAILLVDTICAPFIIPYVLAFFFGADVSMDPFGMLRGLFWMLFFPTFLALVCNRVTQGGLQRIAGQPIAFASKLAVFAILVINGGVVAPFVHDFNLMLLLVFCATLALTAFWYLFSFWAGRLLFPKGEDALALTLTALRGSTTGMVIAMTYFPPMATLVVVFCMLFQQALAAYFGKMARNWIDKKERS